MRETHQWVRHAVHGGYWRCPINVLEAMRAKGWEPCEPPGSEQATAVRRPAAKIVKEA